MKRVEKVISDHILKIEKNGLKVINYKSINDIDCECIKCKKEITDTYRNLSYKNFKCKYCELANKILDIQDGVQIRKIDGNLIHITCKNGHEYIQDRRNLLAGKRCKKCYLSSKIIPKDSIIKKFKELHGSYYSYNFDTFKNVHSIIEIVCSKGHKFQQKVSNHLQGKGCPICRESIGERKISVFLTSNNIKYIRQKKFKDCIYKSELPFDFYLPDLNITIEYDGLQHFQPLVMFGGEEEFKKVQIKDKIKTEYCKSNNIKLIRISYKEDIIEKLKLLTIDQ